MAQAVCAGEMIERRVFNSCRRERRSFFISKKPQLPLAAIKEV